jgi:hypothetical protein
VTAVDFGMLTTSTSLVLLVAASDDHVVDLEGCQHDSGEQRRERGGCQERKRK